MDIKGFFQKNWMYLAVIGIAIIIVAAFFKPQFSGYSVKQHDVKEWRGMSNEIDMYREESGKEPMWTSSAFGGMPTEQISMKYPGNWFKSMLDFYNETVPPPFGSILLHVLCFLVFARLLKINPWVGLLGGIAFGFASYELIVIQAGHTTKSAAAAFLPAILGAFIYAFKTNRLWGIVLSGLFMSFELSVNHVQVTYYFLFVLLFVGIYFLIEAIREKKVPGFLLTSVGIIGVFILSFVINSGNILLTNDYAKYSIRGGNDITIASDGTPAKNQSAGLDRDYITQWSYGIGETFTLISPYVKGGASEKLADSPFAEKIQNSDRTSDQINNAMNGYSYWGTQPITSGPVYVGIVVFMLAFLGLIFMKNKIKWALFAITFLAILLSWGKNFMGLTNFFIDHIPAYNKFRAVTIILIVVEVTIPVMGVLFLNEIIKQRDQILAKKKQVMIALGVFVLFLIIVRVAGLGDGYTNQMESRQYAGLTEMYTDQVMAMDPQTAASYQLDLSNPQQVQQFVKAQVDGQLAAFNDVKEARKDIFASSMTRSILFAIFAAGVFLIFLYSKSDKTANIVLISGLIVLTFADMVPVAYNYLGGVDNAAGTDFKYWEDRGNWLYPMAATKGDEEILNAEVARNPALASKIAKGEAKGKQVADEKELDGIARINAINSYRFYELNRATNYRVLDFSSGFSSSRPTYFHKTLGGYHGAKLRNINNLIEFQLSKTNNKVLDMLNVKYFIQTLQTTGQDTALVNPTAMGNAWLVKNVREFSSPNDEIRALGNKFKLENKGTGVLLVNKLPVKQAEVYGGESLQYLVPGRKDTIPVQLSNGLPKGQQAMFVVDSRGTTNLVPLMTLEIDTTKSFTPLVQLSVESSFDPVNDALMLSDFAGKLSKKKFTAEGTVRLTSSSPNRLTYQADMKGDQLAVFSEIYYPIGWKAFVDGKETPILKVNYLLRGLELKDGPHKIEFVYDLPKYKTVNMIAMIGSIILLLLTAGALYIGFRNKKKAGSGSTTELG